MTGRSEVRSSRVYIYANAVSCFCHGNKSERPVTATSWGLMNRTGSYTQKRDQMVFKMTCLHLSVCTSQKLLIPTCAVDPAATVMYINTSSFLITHMIRSKISDCLGTFTDAPVWIPFQSPNIHPHWHTCPVQNKSTKQQWWLFMQMLWQSFSHLEVLLYIYFGFTWSYLWWPNWWLFYWLSLIFKANDCI